MHRLLSVIQQDPHTLVKLCFLLYILFLLILQKPPSTCYSVPSKFQIFFNFQFSQMYPMLCVTMISIIIIIKLVFTLCHVNTTPWSPPPSLSHSASHHLVPWHTYKWCTRPSDLLQLACKMTSSCKLPSLVLVCRHGTT